MTDTSFNTDDPGDIAGFASYLTGRRPLSTNIAGISRSGATPITPGFSVDGPEDDSLDPTAFRISPGASNPSSFNIKPSAGAGKVLLARSGSPVQPPPGGYQPPPAPAAPMPPPGYSPAVSDDPGTAGLTAVAPGPPINPQITQLQEQEKQLAANPPRMIGETDASGRPMRPQDVDPATGRLKTSAKIASWAQRLGLAAIAATKLAPYAQQIIHPEYTQQVGQQQAQLKNIEQQIADTEKAENVGYLGELREATAQQKLEQGANYAQQEADRALARTETDRIKADNEFTNSIGKDAVTGLQPDDPQVAQLQAQGWHVIDDTRDHRDGVPKMKVAIPPRFVSVTPDNQQILVGRKPGELVPWAEYKSSLAEYEKTQRANATAANKPPTAESEKLTVSNLLQKVAEENGLSSGAMTDVRQLAPLVDKSTTLTPAEKAHVKTYLTMNPTAAATGGAALLRVEGMGQNREYPVIDTKNNNSPMLLSASDVNAANKLEPGRYVPVEAGQKAISSEATMQDLMAASQRVREALTHIPELTPAQKTNIALAMRSQDPSTFNNLITNAATGLNSPEMQNYLVQLRSLHENALVMRNLLGAGQGSESLRAAVDATIPGPLTPSKEYAARQLDTFDKTLDNLHRGILNVPLRKDVGGGNAPPPVAGQIPGIPAGAQIRHSRSNPNIVQYSTDGGKTWLSPKAQ